MLNKMKIPSWHLVITDKRSKAVIFFLIMITILWIEARLITDPSIKHISLFLLVGLGISFLIPTSIILYTMTIVVYSADWFCDILYFIPRQVTWLPDLLVLLLFSRALISIVTERRTIWDFPYLWFLVGNILLMFLSLLYNQENPGLLLPGIKVYLKYIILSFSLFTLEIEPSVYRKWFKLLTLIIFVQIVVSFIQFLHVGAVGDYGGGTLGANSTGLLSILGGIFTCIFLENYFQTRRLRYLLYAFLLFIPAFSGSTKYSFILYPLIYVYYFFRHSKGFKTFLLNIFLMALLIPIFIGIMSIFDKHGKGYMLKFYRNPSDAYKYEMRVSSGRMGMGGRWGSLRYSFELATKDLGHFFLGYGPCSSAESFLGSSFESRLYRSGAFPWSLTNFPRIFVEIGFSGVVLYLCLFIVLLKESRKNFLNRDCIVSILGVVFLSSFYGGTFFADVVAFMFWYFISALHVKNNKGEHIILDG